MEFNDSAAEAAGYIALILVIVVIIALIVFFVYSRTATTSFFPRWTVTTVVTADIIVGRGGSYYLITGPISTAVLRTPIDPVGQEFIIDNSASTTSISFSVGSSSKTVSAGQIATFVWTSATEVAIVATN